MAETKCTSCKRNITNMKGSARFKCPKCSSFEIVRCLACRTFAAKYTCEKCGLIGPN